MLLSGALLSLLGYLTLAILAAEQHFFVVDYGTRTSVQMIKHELLQLPMELVSSLGDRVGLVALIALGCVALWRVSRRWALLLPVLMAGTWALQWITKWSVARPRPDRTAWGFPSGHALSVVVFFGLMIYLIATASERRRRWRVLACAICASTVALVAFSRLYLDRHWLSDVVGGLAVGTAYLLLAIWMVEVVGTGRRRRTRPEEPPPPARESGSSSVAQRSGSSTA
jgi:undecaprenyl-diphosphatase